MPNYLRKKVLNRKESIRKKNLEVEGMSRIDVMQTN